MLRSSRPQKVAASRPPLASFFPEQPPHSDPVAGSPDSTASAVYDFSFDEGAVGVHSDHTFTVTMSYELPVGMSFSPSANPGWTLTGSTQRQVSPWAREVGK